MLKLKTEGFDGLRLIDSRNILAVFYADWCPFCRTFLELFETTMKNKANPVGATVDISDTQNPLWETFEIAIVPTLIGFRNGKAVVRKNGVAGVGLGNHELNDAVLEMSNR
jgi:thiol-disulfide isomerase/thioredoxin